MFAQMFDSRDSYLIIGEVRGAVGMPVDGFYVVSRGRTRPVISQMELVLTINTIQPFRQMLDTGTDVITTVEVDYVVEVDAKATLLEWVEKRPLMQGQLGARWMEWANSETVVPVSSEGVAGIVTAVTAEYDY